MRAPDAGLPSSSGVIARLAYARAKAAGIALAPLASKAGLTIAQLEDPRMRVNARDQIAFLNLAAEVLKDDLLGFHLAQAIELREIGLIYYAMASSATLLEALQRAARYTVLLNEGVALQCIDRGDITLSFGYVGVSRHTDRHQIEMWMTALIRICRQLTGLRLVPRHWRMTHFREDRDHAEFDECAGRAVEFGATADEIVFDAEAKLLPVVSADSHLNRLLTAYCEEALSGRRRSRDSFSVSVENAIVPLLPHGNAKASEVARRLGVSQRTLARRLAADGLTFSELLENLRADLADRYLADEQVSISQVAWLLGYREVGAFSHAYKRRTGKTPREARARLTAPDS